MSRRILLRLAIWIPLLLLVVAGKYWLEWRAEQERGDPSTRTERGYQALPHRYASPEEWALPIAELGQRQLAKKLVYRPLERVEGANLASRGELVWLHDGQGERLAYLAAPSEDASAAAPALGIALREGKAVLFDLHGDPELVQRIRSGEMPVDYQLPEGWTVLLPPG